LTVLSENSPICTALRVMGETFLFQGTSTATMVVGSSHLPQMAADAVPSPGPKPTAPHAMVTAAAAVAHGTVTAAEAAAFVDAGGDVFEVEATALANEESHTYSKMSTIGAASSDIESDGESEDIERARHE
jgi:hypothetical protein